VGAPGGNHNASGMRTELALGAGHARNRHEADTARTAANPPPWRQYNIHYFGRPSPDDLIVRMGPAKSDCAVFASSRCPSFTDESTDFGATTSSSLPSTPRASAMHGHGDHLDTNTFEGHITVQMNANQDTACDLTTEAHALAAEQQQLVAHRQPGATCQQEPSAARKTLTGDSSTVSATDEDERSLPGQCGCSDEGA